MALLREVLENIVAPQTATALLFDALERSGRGPPSTLEDARTFAQNALADAIRGRVRPDEASQIIRLIDEFFARAIENDGLAIEVDVTETGEHDDPSATAQMAVVQKPVPVVVFEATGAFAERLTACLGEDRVFAVVTVDETSLRKAVFCYAPLVLVVDGVSPPPDVDPLALAAVLRGLPHASLPVLWGSETRWGRELLEVVEPAGVKLVTLDRREGIEPLLDLVLAHFHSEV
jgi:hypothetical protein